MTSQLTIYEWNSRNRDFLQKVLKQLEKMYEQNWIERKSSFLSTTPLGGQPTEYVVERTIKLTKVNAVSDAKYPELLSFRLLSFITEPDAIVYDKVALDYGRCVLYLCDAVDEITQRKYVHVLMYDRESRNWHYIRTIPSSGGLSSFLEWIS